MTPNHQQAAEGVSEMPHPSQIEVQSGASRRIDSRFYCTLNGKQYVRWEYAGGPDECSHGYARCFTCPYCQPVSPPAASPRVEVDKADDGKWFVYMPCGEEIAICHSEEHARWIADRWNTRVAPAPDPGEYPGVAARFKQDFGVDHPRQMRKSEMAAPDPRVEEILPAPPVQAVQEKP